MTITELLTDLIARGVEFQAHGDMLRFRPMDRLNATDVENIRRHKSALLGLLRAEGRVNRHPAADPQPRTSCNRCASADYVDTPIHNGRSLRRDCSQCHRFLGWPSWYDKCLETETDGED